MSERSDGLPEFIDLERYGPRGRRKANVFRGVTLAAILVLLVLGLVNMFGQRPRHTEATGADATLAVDAPTRLRGGLLYQGRFRIDAQRLVRHATLVLDRGWTEGMSINTVEPAPIGEASRDGLLTLDFGAIQPGATLTAYLQFQVNPTNVGRRPQGVTLADGERQLERVERTVTVFP